MALTQAFPELSHSQHLSDNLSLQDSTKLNQVMHILYKLSQKQPLFTFNNHERYTEPHETANTQRFLHLHFLTLESSSRFWDTPFGAQGHSPHLPHQWLPLPLAHRATLLYLCITLSFLTKLLPLPKMLPSSEIQTLPHSCFVLVPPERDTLSLFKILILMCFS